MEDSSMGIPDEIFRTDEMVENAIETDDAYAKIYNELSGRFDGAKAADVISLIAKVKAEHTALFIGNGLTEYDKRLLRSIIERHIAGIVFKE